MGKLQEGVMGPSNPAGRSRKMRPENQPLDLVIGRPSEVLTKAAWVEG